MTYIERESRERALLEVLKTRGADNVRYAMSKSDRDSFNFWDGYVAAIEDAIYYSENKTENIKPLMRKRGAE